MTRGSPWGTHCGAVAWWGGSEDEIDDTVKVLTTEPSDLSAEQLLAVLL